MPRRDKGFSRLKHENIEMNTFHESESDDDDGMRVLGNSSDCSCCATRWAKMSAFVNTRIIMSLCY